MGNTTAIHNLNEFEVVNQEDCLEQDYEMNENDVLLEQQRNEWDNRIENWHNELQQSIDNDLDEYETLKEEEAINKEIQEQINYEEYCNNECESNFQNNYCEWMEHKIQEYEEDQRQARAKQVGKWWIQFKIQHNIPKKMKLYNYRSIYDQVQKYVRNGIGKLSDIRLNTYNLRNRK